MDKIGMVHRDSLSCEAIVRKLPDGSLLLLSQCGGMGEPCPENRVLVFHSADGETWSKPSLIREENGRALYATDVDVNGNVVTAYITEHNGSYLDTDCYALVSRDGGNSWQPTANEMLALAYLRDGKTAEAKEIYNRLLADGKTPEVMKARIKDIISVLPQ